MLCPNCGQDVEPTKPQCPGCGAPMHPFAAPRSPMAAGPVTPPIPPGAVPTYLVQSILCTLFCCMPLGVVAIVFAALSTGNVQSGNYAVAMENARMAKTFCWLSFWLGLVPIVLWLGYVAVIASIAIASSM